MDPESLLKYNPLFKDLCPESRKALASICVRRTVKKKKPLFAEGERGHALYLLGQGAIRLHKTTPAGREIVIKIVRPGEVFAEAILFDKDTYPVTATALKDSLLYLLPKDRFHGLLAEENFRTDFIRGLLAKHRYLTTRIMYLTSHDAEERLFLFLKDQFGPHEEITPTISKKETAAAIGTTPETFSRLLLKLRKEKTLCWENKKIRLRKGFWKNWG